MSPLIESVIYYLRDDASFGIPSNKHTHKFNHMRKTFLVLAAFAILTSCKKNDNENIEEPKKLSPDIEVLVKGATQETQPLYERPKDFNFLGFGYDVTDQYNDEASVRRNVVDVQAYAASGNYRVVTIRGTQGSWTTIQAKDAVGLSEKFSNSTETTKGLRLFGNTIQKAFPGTVTSDKKYIYGHYSSYMIWKSYAFGYDDYLNDYLTLRFKNDIATLSPKDLVKEYGTHVLTGIEMGSRFNVVYQAEAPADDRDQVILEGLRYALKRTFGLPTGYLDNVNLKNLNANSSAQIYYSSIGGDINTLKTEIIANRVMLNITNWWSTNTEENARFIGVYDDGLIPLDSFINDPIKKAAVKAYLEQLFATKAVKLTN